MARNHLNTNYLYPNLLSPTPMQGLRLRPAVVLRGETTTRVLCFRAPAPSPRGAKQPVGGRCEPPLGVRTSRGGASAVRATQLDAVEEAEGGAQLQLVGFTVSTQTLSRLFQLRRAQRSR
jgi:hypothetical protein